MRIRLATDADAARVAAIDVAARCAALPRVHWAHGAEEVRDWIAGRLIPEGDVWVADEGGDILGTIALRDGWVAQFYVAPAHWRHGVGHALMDHAKTLHPHGLKLWCFQANAGARAFYEAQGFVATLVTDGIDNEEREPDMIYAWPADAAAPS
jgi:putative acetyltransferase